MSLTTCYTLYFLSLPMQSPSLLIFVQARLKLSTGGSTRARACIGGSTLDRRSTITAIMK
ncbi:hypothetical protein K443DRAFT_259381 [Laccaria amethystina LaAM-08-1]|uniref:Uncharacterized protein n=1 Tax=Laccaria amethystina LaAM-08-1 TaxID=1095629 RepID=A0A0C9XLY8_9AGAR|nr:hypothetical protein K443DRAFT_259381 [Laccaria amethystina LaAM-08-1]